MALKQKIRPYIPFLISLLLGGVLFTLVDDFVATIIIMPLLRVIWFLSVVLQSFHQGFLWFGFILVMLIITIKLLIKREDTAKPTWNKSVMNRGSVERWTRLLENAESSNYSKWRLAQRLKRTTRRLLSPSDPDQTNRYDLSGLDLPAEIREYFDAQHPTNQPFRRRRFKRTRETDGALELDPEAVLAYLKERLNL